MTMQGVKRAIGASVLLAAVALAGTASAQTKTATVNAISATGVGASIGTISFRDSRYGLVVEPKLTGLPPGPHGFHIHANPNCGPGPGANNQPAAGMAAGGHYDPKAANKHRGPHTDDSHLGDLPILVVDANGAATLPVIAKRLKASDLAGRSVMIHAGSDNFDDAPNPLGGGGGRIACGVIQ
jgi:Cu-Zn family superoxide dismutase